MPGSPDETSLDGHVLDTERRELRRGCDAIAVEPQVLDLLIYLVENRDRVVSRDDLLASIWDGRIVSDATLTSRIYAARKAIDDRVTFVTRRAHSEHDLRRFLA
jgi:DNA-binding winged helix-turn-helix (wHTH) protein